MTSGGTNPPSPPAAPTMPVTEPTLVGGDCWATSANTAPLPAPSAAAMVRKNTVPAGVSDGVKACPAAPTVTTASATVRTRAGPNRSDSQPPAGRAATASSTNPAIRFAASAWARPYAVFRYVGRYTENATYPPNTTAYSAPACQVMASRAVDASRRPSGSDGTTRPGASRSSTKASTAYTASAAAVSRNGAAMPFADTSFTVVSALIAVPPMPAPKTPIARPRRCGGNHAFTNRTPTATP